jgi:hypothetical protein
VAADGTPESRERTDGEAPLDGTVEWSRQESADDGTRPSLQRVDETIRTAGTMLVERVPQLRPHLRRLREDYARVWIRAVQFTHNRRHSAPIDPYRIRWVDPARIQYVSRGNGQPRFKRLGTVEGGDWDERELRFTDTLVYRGFVERFEEGKAWAETVFYRRILDQIRSGRTRWNCRTRADLDRRCADLDEFYRTLRRDGFRTQAELVAADDEETVSRNRQTLHSRIVNDEVAVDVGRRGGLLFADGRNRLSLAKLLDVDELPVVVLRRHPTWVAFRDAVSEHVDATGVLPDAVADHPDLRQFTDG